MSSLIFYNFYKKSISSNNSNNNINNRKKVIFSKFINNKRGAVFFTLILSAILITFVTLIYFNAVSESEKQITKKIGQKQLELFRTYQKGENLLYFADDSAKLAIKGATESLAKQGGLPEDATNYIGAPLWYQENQDIRPKNYQDNFRTVYSDELKAYLLYSSYYNSISFSTEISVSQNSMSITGVSDNPLMIPINDGFITNTPATINYVVPAGQKAQIAQIKEKYYDIIKKIIADNNYDLEPELVMAYIMLESKGDPNAISGTGCAGIMQICMSSAYENIISKNRMTTCCPRINGKYVCNKNTMLCNVNNDDRFNLDLNIQNGIKLIDDKGKNFKKYTDKVEFTMAAYNGGEAVVKDAIEATGLTNPTWDQVSEKVTSDIIQKRLGNYFKTLSEQTEKATQVRNYVPYVYAYYREFKPKAEIEDNIP